MLKCDNGSTETEVRKWTKTEVRKPKYENEKKSRLSVSKLSSTLCSENDLLCHYPILPNVAYYAIYLRPLFHIVLSKNSIIVLKHEWHALQYCLQEHVVVDLKTQRSQLVSSQSSVAAIFWFFYTCFGFKGHLSHDSKWIGSKFYLLCWHNFLC